jgi:hypothetical protein
MPNDTRLRCAGLKIHQTRCRRQEERFPIICLLATLRDSPVLAQGCRLRQWSKVANYPGYIGRAANVVARAALDPKQNWRCRTMQLLPK